MVKSNRREQLARIERLCAAGLAERELRVRLLAGLAASVPYDAHAFLLTDPVTCVGASPLAAIPGLPYDELPRLIRAKYLTTVNRWTSLTGVAGLMTATDGALDHSRAWREVQRDLGVTDVASMVFRDGHGCWGFLDLWRIGSGQFDADDLDVLADLAPAVTRGLRAALAATFTTIEPGGSLGPVVLLLDERLAVRSQTPATDAWLRLLNPPDRPVAPIPAQAYNVAAQLLARESGVDDHEPRSRAHLAGGRWVTLRAARLGPDIAVSIEECTTAERVELFGLTHGLTPRELEVLTLLCGGASTREVARRLVVSEHTAHDHVRSILARAGTRTLQILLSRALGSSASGLAAPLG